MITVIIKKITRLKGFEVKTKYLSCFRGAFVSSWKSLLLFLEVVLDSLVKGVRAQV